MSLSVWRYAHLVLALFASLLISVAALTGIVLAVEPVVEAKKGFREPGFDTLRVSDVVSPLRKAIPGIQQLRVDDRGFVAAKWTDKDGKERQAFISPRSGKELGPVTPRPPVFEWTTTLHRSLFLHESGRLIVGITAVLLILIVLSGICLLLQRQGGVRGYFSRVERTSFSQYNHVVSGRVALFFILALALTGGYLSVSRFIIKPVKASLKVDLDNIKEEPQIAADAFPVFRSTKLSDIRVFEFPFSEFPEDYFSFKSKNGEAAVNQFTGEVLAKTDYTPAFRLNEWSLAWHTGRASVAWAIIMAVTAGYILFFIYTGFAITIRRRKGRIRNRFKAADADVVILVGSENGSTLLYAKSIFQQLLTLGRKPFMAELNAWRGFPQARHLIVMTSTHGQGEPPANASRFLEQLKAEAQIQSVATSVIGFGSKNYPQFCRFAAEADAALASQGWAHPSTGLMTVNDHSLHDFSLWLNAWSAESGIPLVVDEKLGRAPVRVRRRFSVLSRTGVNPDGAFTVRFKTRRRMRLRSGDLLAVYPTSGAAERLYSVARIGGQIHLSVRLHPGGLGSGYLYALNPGERIFARVISNSQFHFPQRAPQVILIGNGTGVAPFLGMITENRRKIPLFLYCGFRTAASYEPYEQLLREHLATRRLKAVRDVYSREQGREYLSAVIAREQDFFWTSLKGGAVLMICGSLNMYRDVLAVLDAICLERSGEGVAAFSALGQIRSDCY